MEVDWTIADLPYAAPEEPASYARRNDAFHRIKEACAGFSNAERSGEQDIFNLAESRARKDSIRVLTDDVAAAVKTGQPADRKAALSAVLQNGDPLLIEGTLERLLVTKSEGRVSYWIDGQLTHSDEINVFQKALDALPCELGLLCDSREATVLQECIGSGKCFVSRTDQIRATLSAEEQRRFDARLANLVAAVRQKQVERLLP